MILLVIAVTLAGHVAAQVGLCPQPSGDFPNPSSEQCTTFFRCIQGQPNLLRCPANQRFDFLFRICRAQAQVDCNNQLQIYAAPNNGPNGAAGPGAVDGAGVGGGALGGALGGGLGGLGGLGGALGGGLGGALGAGVGAGLPQAGLINFLLSRGGDGDGDGGNNNQIALIAALGQMMSQRRAAAARPVIQQPQQRPQQAPSSFNQQAVPLFNPGGPFAAPLPPQAYPPPAADPRIVPLVRGTNGFVDQRGGFGGAFPLPPLTSIVGQVPVPIPGIVGLQGQAQGLPLNDANNFNVYGGPPGPGTIQLQQFNPGQLQSLIDLATTVQQTQQVIDRNDDNDDNSDSN